jgi:hypothetical protein
VTPKAVTTRDVARDHQKNKNRSWLSATRERARRAPSAHCELRNMPQPSERPRLPSVTTSAQHGIERLRQ